MANNIYYYMRKHLLKYKCNILTNKSIPVKHEQILIENLIFPIITKTLIKDYKNLNVFYKSPQEIYIGYGKINVEDLEFNVDDEKTRNANAFFSECINDPKILKAVDKNKQYIKIKELNNTNLIIIIKYFYPELFRIDKTESYILNEGLNDYSVIEKNIKQTALYEELKGMVLNEKFEELEKYIKNDRFKTIDDKIHGIELDMQKLSRRLNEYETMLREQQQIKLALIKNNEDFTIKSLLDFIKTSDKIKVENVYENSIEVSIDTYISIWKDEYLEAIKSSQYSSAFVLTAAERMSKSLAVRLFQSIFEERTAKIKINQSFKINFESNTIDAINKCNDKENAIRNIHISRYECWDESKDMATRFLMDGRYFEMANALIASASNINLIDSIVNSAFVEECFKTKCIEYKDELYTLDELAKRIEKEGNSNNE